MAERNKKFIRDLLLFLVIMGFIYGCTIRCAMQERELKKKWQQHYKKDTTQVYHENVKRSEGPHKRITIVHDTDKGDVDPYDDPDFDDLIPGEEYDEEFIDRSQGDPELYE